MGHVERAHWGAASSMGVLRSGIQGYWGLEWLGDDRDWFWVRLRTGIPNGVPWMGEGCGV